MIVYLYNIRTNISITWDESKSTPQNVSYQVSSHPNVSHSPWNGWISSWAVSVVTLGDEAWTCDHMDTYGYLVKTICCSEFRVMSTYSRKMLSNLLEHGSSCGPSLWSLPTKKLPLTLLMHHDLHFSGILDIANMEFRVAIPTSFFHNSVNHILTLTWNQISFIIFRPQSTCQQCPLGSMLLEPVWYT